MLVQRKSSRVKTEGDKLAVELQRQKSIFKNLSWQVKQKDRKISFLSKYYGQMQAVIEKQKQKDLSLVKRANESSNNKHNRRVYQSNILKRLQQFQHRRRIATEGYQQEEGTEWVYPQRLPSTVLKSYKKH